MKSLKNEEGKLSTGAIVGIVIGVILAIVIVGVIAFIVMVSAGVQLFNRAENVANGTIDSINSLGDEAFGFNAQFNQYMGQSQKASVAQGLIDKVMANNKENGETTIKVQLVAGAGLTTSKGPSDNESDLLAMRSAITNKNTVYKIEIAEYDENGMISKITIEGVDKEPAE